MAVDFASWLMDQPGVQHPSSVARTLAWAATAGQRGVVGSASFGVVAQAVPNGTVQVRPGAAVLPSTYAGSGLESYIARARTATNVTITPTGSSGKRSDALILRIDDTGKTGVTPTDVQGYEYTKLQVITGVSASLTDSDSLGLAYPSILLARIDIPASTGTITAAMIKDMRHVALAREETVQFPRPAVSSDPATALQLNATASYPAGEWFPNIGGPANNGRFLVDIPKWATRMQIRMEWIGVFVPGGAGHGAVWAAYGPTAGDPTPANATQATGWDADTTADSYRTNLVIVEEVPIPAAWRGTQQPIVPRGNRVAVTGQNNRIKLTGTSGINLEVRFLERPDTDLQAD